MILDFEQAEADARKRGGEFEYAWVGDDCRPSLERQAQDAVAQAVREERERCAKAARLWAERASTPQGRVILNAFADIIAVSSEAP